MCKPLKQSELDKIHHGKEVTSATFILVERGGGCSFTTKVRNVEDAGASLAIIIDNKNENIEMINMIDDGAGAGIRIPSMLISKRDGERILDYIRTEQKKEKAAEEYRKRQGGGRRDDDDEEKDEKESELDRKDPCEGKEDDERKECEEAEAEKKRKREEEKEKDK